MDRHSADVVSFPHLSSHKAELPAGRYMWPFRIAIPNAEQLPTSLEDIIFFGYVLYRTYSLIAYVEISSIFTKHIECKRMLYVAPQAPLDKRRHLFTQMELNASRKVSN